MSRAIYSCITPTVASIALTGGTARTILGAKAHANSGLDLLFVSVSYDGVTSSAVPVYTELCYSTWATNSPGTQSTTLASPAITQKCGRVMTAGFTAAHSWVAANEPTVLTPIDQQVLTPNGGLIKWQFPLGTEPDCALAEGFAIRCKAAATVNVVAQLDVARN